MLAFLDDDDEWEPAKIERQVRELERTGAHVCVTGITIARDSRRVVRVPTAKELTVDSLIAHRVVAAHPSSVLVKRASFLGPIGVVDEDIPGSYGEDYDWLLRAARLGPIAVVEEPLVLVHWGKQSYFADRWQTIIDANDYLLAKHPEFAASKVGLSRLHGRKAIALAALGQRREARVWARKALRLNPPRPPRLPGVPALHGGGQGGSRHAAGQPGGARTVTEVKQRDMQTPHRVRSAGGGAKKAMLVGSGGGHLAQLLALRPWWRDLDRSWVCFDAPDARSQLADERVVWAYSPTTRNLVNLVRNFFLAIKVLRRERPDVVISTGAGVAVPFFLIARVLGIADDLRRGDRPGEQPHPHRTAVPADVVGVLRAVARAGQAVSGIGGRGAATLRRFDYSQ